MKSVAAVRAASPVEYPVTDHRTSAPASTATRAQPPRGDRVALTMTGRRFWLSHRAHPAPVANLGRVLELRGWTDWVRAPFTRLTLAGDHLGLFRDDNVGRIAAVVDDLAHGAPPRPSPPG